MKPESPIALQLSPESGKPASTLTRFLRQWDYQIMIIPSMLFIIIFSYIPMYGVLISFQDYNLFTGFWESPWVGFKHFRMFFEAPEFWDIMRNTLAISFLKLLLGFPAPIILALMLNEIRLMVFKRVIQTVTYIPHFISWVVVSGMIFSMLSVDGSGLNTLLMKLSWIDEPITWLSEPNYFWGIIVTSNIWKEIGFGSIVYLAAIAGVDPNLYEAAAIDGASRFKQIFVITIPSIAPIIIIFLILAVSNILNAGFEDIILLTKNLNNGIVMPVANVIDTYVYQEGIIYQRYSYATAAGLFKSVLSILVLIVANAIARKLGKASLW